MENYLIHNGLCAISYSMGENSDPDIAVRETFEDYGFTVEYEDAGARHTVFDNFDTLPHFKRVADFERVFASLDGLDRRSSV